MTDETVFVAGCSDGGVCDTFHTDPDCRALALAESVLQYSHDNINSTRSQCSICADSCSDSTSPDFTFYRAAVDHD